MKRLALILALCSTLTACGCQPTDTGRASARGTAMLFPGGVQHEKILMASCGNSVEDFPSGYSQGIVPFSGTVASVACYESKGTYLELKKF